VPDGSRLGHDGDKLVNVVLPKAPGIPFWRRTSSSMMVRMSGATLLVSYAERLVNSGHTIEDVVDFAWRDNAQGSSAARAIRSFGPSCLSLGV